MTSISRRAIPAILAAFDFSRFGTIVDVGGGNGALLANILSAHPNVKGVLFDQPHVVPRAAEVLNRAGVAERCHTVGGSFFESVPAGADAYLLRAVIHDWDDEESIRILKVVRRALPQHGRVLVIEGVVAPPNEGRDTKFSDLNMLVNPNGRERTHEEFEKILSSAELRIVGAHKAGRSFILDASPT